MAEVRVNIPVPKLDEEGNVVLPDGRSMTQEAYEAAWNKLAEPFPPEWIEKRAQSSKGNVLLDYVGHAGITMRLNEVDPCWTWEPLAYSQSGEPLIGQFGMWGRLTILGHSKVGFGDAGRNEGTANGVKEIIGDFLRNAAMRFNVGTYLWSKSAHAEELKKGPQAPPRPQTPSERAGAVAYNSGLFSSEDDYKVFAVEAAGTDKIDNLTEDEATAIINAINNKKEQK